MTSGNDKATRNIMYEEIVKAGIEFTIYVFLSQVEEILDSGATGAMEVGIWMARRRDGSFCSGI